MQQDPCVCLSIYYAYQFNCAKEVISIFSMIDAMKGNINELFNEGHTIIYWTARGATSGLNWFNHTYNMLKENGALFTELRMGKPAYDFWVDDKAINPKILHDPS